MTFPKLPIAGSRESVLACLPQGRSGDDREAAMRFAARACIGGFLYSLVGLAVAAATLSGMVSLNHERGSPVAGVEVFAAGANPTISGREGRFLLKFPDGRAGQDVRVQVRRPGWAVVNDFVLDHRLPDSANARPLEVVICLSAEREQRMAEFFRLKGSEVVEKTYRAKLAEREGRLAATADERDRLVRERDQALKQVAEGARLFASRGPEEVGSAYKEAVRLFLEGSTDAALARLSDERLDAETRNAEQRLNQVALSWLLKGQLLSTKFDFEAAGRAFQKAVTVAPESYSAWFGFALFHQQQNQYAEARRGYQKSVDIASQDANASRLAAALNNLGMLSRDEGRTTEAFGQYTKALDIYRSTAMDGGPGHLSDVAAVLTNLGELSSDSNQFVAARRHYEEALTINRSLAAKNPDAYAADLAAALNNLGNLSTTENRNVEAHRLYDEALLVFRLMDQNKPETYSAAIASTLMNLGNLNSNENRLSEARGQLEEALGIFRKLAASSPKVHSPDVAATLAGLGNLNQREQRRTEARSRYEEALELYRKAAEQAPDVYLPYVATTLTNLGLLGVKTREADARGRLEEAVAIRRSLAQRNPELHKPQYANTLNILGNLSRAEGRGAEARAHLSEALSIQRDLVRANPNVYLPLLASTLFNLGVLSSAEGQISQARAFTEESLEARRSLARTNPDVYLPSVAETLVGLAWVRTSEGSSAAARELLEESLGIYRQFAAREPAAYAQHVQLLEQHIRSLPQ